MMGCAVKCVRWAVLCGVLLFSCVAAQGSPVLQKAPEVFVLAATQGVQVVGLTGRTYEVLPLQRFSKGHQLVLRKGARLSLMMVGTGHRRVFKGPARLWVGQGVVSVRAGVGPQVSPLRAEHVDLVRRWLADYPRPIARAEKSPSSDLEVVSPLDGVMLLHRAPEFEFKGTLPKEGSFLLFDAQGKRFWIQQLEAQRLVFPNAVEFEWGQRFTWEVRKRTGGRVLSGAFHIATEDTARTLFNARVPDRPSTLPETLLLYGMRLQLAGAYHEADSVWQSLGFQIDNMGRPSWLER